MKPRHTALIRAARRGFTLLELLVVVVMFAVLMGALNGLLFGALALREQSFERYNGAIPPDRLAHLLRRDLAGMLPPAPLDESGDTEITVVRGSLTGTGPFAGDMLGETDQTATGRADRLTFYTTAGTVADAAPWGDAMRVGYYLEAPADGSELAAGMDFVRLETRNLLPSTTERIDVAPDSARLARNVATLTLEYYDAENDIWEDSWDSTMQDDQLPDAIRVRIEPLPPEAGDTDAIRRAPIEIVVAPTIQPRAGVEAAGAGSGSSGQGGGGA